MLFTGEESRGSSGECSMRSDNEHSHKRQAKRHPHGLCLSPRSAASLSAENCLRMLVPKCSNLLYARLVKERIRTVADLAGLDKDDLRELGLGMVERGRVLRWAREAFPDAVGATSRESSPGTPGYDIGREMLQGLPPFRDHESDIRLDEIEQLADFWCTLVADTPLPLISEITGLALEERFDVTPERVSEVYLDMCRHSVDTQGHISASELKRGLHRCGLAGFGDAAMATILEAVLPAHTRGLKLSEFETIISRLKLAQLVVATDHERESNSSRDGASPLSKRDVGPRTDSFALSCSFTRKPLLTVVDYSASYFHKSVVPHSRFREFCFGHRARASSHEPSIVRWVHLDSLVLGALFACAVKYSLHPLGVEDVLEQCPTKVDRYGLNYFAAVERLSLVSDEPGSDADEPVCVAGFHVVCFCSGPPAFDTIITVTQPDRSFESDWPGMAEMRDWAGSKEPCGASPARPLASANASANAWAEKLQLRLSTQRSRLRERRADFLMYHVLDICTDDLSAVTRAYAARLMRLEITAIRDPAADSDVGETAGGEASIVSRQLAVVLRRVKGLQRMVRHLLNDPSLAPELSRYLQDVADHLDEASDDISQLVEKCSAIVSMRNVAQEKRQDLNQQLSAERLNKTVYILTMGTFIFAPMQFLVGVYGMNFADEDGRPSIPELMFPRGYLFFWCVIVVYLVIALCFFAFCVAFVGHRDRRKRRSLMWRSKSTNDDSLA